MIFFILFFLSLILPIYTDNVILKNGKEYKNVKITMTEKEIEILSPTRKDTFSRKMVQSIKFKPVFWNTTPGKKEIAEERLRAIDLLMENPMWQPQKDQKPQLAIFPFEAGKGISKAEAELYTKLIKSSIIQKKLFIVVDETTYIKKLQQSNCRNKKCAEEIAHQLKANKLLTGSISRLGTKVFITADVVDIHSRTIDFSEVIEIDEKGNIPQFIDSFTTQIAGGSLEKWSYEALNPDQGEPSHIPHLWRSALIPGWGQLHKDSYFMAAFYNIAFIATAMNAKNKSNIYNSKLNEYNNYKLFMYSTLFGENKEQILQSPLLVEIKRNEVKSSAVNANTAVSLLVGIYIVNLIDAYIVPIRKNVPKVNVEVGSDMFFNNSYPPNKITGNVRWDISLEFKF